MNWSTDNKWLVQRRVLLAPDFKVIPEYKFAFPSVNDAVDKYSQGVSSVIILRPKPSTPHLPRIPYYSAGRVLFHDGLEQNCRAPVHVPTAIVFKLMTLDGAFSRLQSVYIALSHT
jgi:hypothetical protein